MYNEEELKAAMAILDAIALDEDIKLTEIQTKVGKAFNYEVLVRLIDYEFIKLSGQQEYSYSLQIIKNWWITKRGLKA